MIFYACVSTCMCSHIFGNSSCKDYFAFFFCLNLPFRSGKKFSMEGTHDIDQGMFLHLILILDIGQLLYPQSQIILCAHPHFVCPGLSADPPMWRFYP